MLKIAVVGASGYTGVELVRFLARHPDVDITCVTSRQHVGVRISDVFPSLRSVCDLVCDPVDSDLICEKADFIFTALPHKTAMEVVPGFLKAGKKVVDLSADYRLNDADIYESWYQKHTSPELFSQAVYGLPELYREQISGASLVANPGCYPTSASLALVPLLKAGAIACQPLIIDSKSGTSGAGRGLKQGSLFCEVNEGFMAYGVGSHRHTPEIEQTLSEFSGSPVVVSFTPHLLPLNRGILSTCYAQGCAISTASLLDIYREFYAADPFIRVMPEGSLPNVAFVRGSNYCDLGAVFDERTGRVVAVAAIDNLVRGASGQAVQNMNLMMGFAETSGLDIVPVFP